VVDCPKKRQLFMLRESRTISLQLLLNVSVVFHGTRHTHKLELLNTRDHGENICADRTRLTSTILAARIPLCRRQLSRLW